MNQLIFCYGCGKQVHVSAVACPHCGAPAASASQPVSAVAARPCVAVSNKIVWVLAFAPVIGWFLEGVFAFSAHGDNEAAAIHAWADNAFWYVTLILNIGLELVDYSLLRKANVETKSLKGWGLIIPVYLFKRAKILGQGKAYFITWLVCFVLTLLSGFGMEGSA